MKTKTLTEILERVEAWPADVQDQLAAFVLELDASLTEDGYQPTAEELAGIDRGPGDTVDDLFASDEERDAAIGKSRRQ